MRRCCLWLLLSAIAGSAHAAETSSAAAIVLPPVATVAVGKKGPFAGVDTRKSAERFDTAAHRRLVAAFDAKLGGKTLPADVVLGLLSNAKVTAKNVSTPEALKTVATTAKVEWLVAFSFGKSNTLTAQIHDAQGAPVGDAYVLTRASNGLNDAQAKEVAEQLAPRILVLEKARLDTLAELARQAAVVTPKEEEFVDTELTQLNKKRSAPAGTSDEGWKPDPDRTRAWVAIGPGAALRDLQLSGETADQLALLENGGVVGLGVAASLFPLELFDATGGKAWSQLSLEVHYRRAFVQARTEAAGFEGACSMTDDDLQLRAGWRYRLGEAGGYLPTIGVAGGWSQEQTRFECNLPLVSTTWRGVDAQLRVRQPLFKNIVTLELVGGPRVILPGPLAAQPGFSFSGEAWLEVKPVSILFARAGGRASYLQAANPQLSAIDTRAFFALELGAFF